MCLNVSEVINLISRGELMSQLCILNLKTLFGVLSDWIAINSRVLDILSRFRWIDIIDIMTLLINEAFLDS